MLSAENRIISESVECHPLLLYPVSFRISSTIEKCVFLTDHENAYNICDLWFTVCKAVICV